MTIEKQLKIKVNPQDQEVGVLRTKAIHFVDENGRTRAVLGVGKAGPQLRLADENGKTRATLFVDKRGPRLRLADENGKTRATLSVPDEGPKLILYNENGRPLWRAP